MGPPSNPMSASQVRRVSLSSPVELTTQLAAEAAAVVAKGGFYSEGVDEFVISSNRQTSLFS